MANTKGLIKPKKKRKKKNPFIVWCKGWYDVLEIVVWSFTPNWMIKKNKKSKK